MFQNRLRCRRNGWIEFDVMNRGLAWFVGLMLALGVLLGVGIWWIGPTLTNLAFVDERRSQAYVVLDLARDAKDSYRARYSLPLAELVLSEAGEVRDQYQLDHMLTGRVADEWRFLRLLKFSAATDLVQVLTSTPYRVLEESVEQNDVLKLGSFTMPVAGWRPVLVVWLVASERAVDPLGALIASAQSEQGRLVWDAKVDAIESQPRWDRVVVVDFADTATAYAWLRSDATDTERTVSRTRVADLALIVYTT
jgi:hypothetical protein